MDYGVSPYDEPYARPRRGTNYFAWTIVILLLTGFALAAWLGSFYIFDQPERPDSYRILQRLHKIDQPKRFQLTAAPAGEFLSAKQLYDRYIGMGSAELARANAELARNYIRNYQLVRGLVPYVVGQIHDRSGPGTRPRRCIYFRAWSSWRTPRIVANCSWSISIRRAPESVPLMKQTLNVGLEVKLERNHDISAVLHAERLMDGRIMITAVPLLYGSYTVTRGLGTFRLEPPLSLNLLAGWPIFKAEERATIDQRIAEFRQNIAASQGRVPIPGLSPSATPPPADNQLIRVEQARPVGTPPPAPGLAKGGKLAAATPLPKGRKGRKQKLESPAPAVTPAHPVVAQNSPAPSATPLAVAAAMTPRVPVATPAPTSATTQAPPAITATPIPVLPALPVPADASAGTLASNAGGGSWKTFPPGKMPLGRLIGTGDLRDVAERGLAGERVYLKGQFVVNFSDANRAVLRPRTKLTEKVLHLGGGSSTRIVVEFPAGYTPPQQGAVVNRDELRPFEITEVRKQDDGQLNVFVAK
jgi:hypothetical protein